VTILVIALLAAWALAATLAVALCLAAQRGDRAQGTTPRAAPGRGIRVPRLRGDRLGRPGARAERHVRR